MQQRTDPLEEFLPPDLLRRTQLVVDVPSRVAIYCASATTDGLVKVGSNPAPWLIVLHPEFYLAGTATGEALRAHEMFHVWQRTVVPNFDAEFAKEAAITEADGKEPWENPYEKPAYAFEQDIKQKLIERGFRG